MAINKYRPCLTEDNIDTILSLCEQHPCFEVYEVVAILMPYKRKIANGGETPVPITGARFASPPNSEATEPKLAAETLAARDLRIALDTYKSNPKEVTVKQYEKLFNYFIANEQVLTKEEWGEFNDALMNANMLAQEKSGKLSNYEQDTIDAQEEELKRWQEGDKLQANFLEKEKKLRDPDDI